MLGTALARFELSALPGNRTVVLRILKFMTPVTMRSPKYDGKLPFPKEGELFCHRRLEGPLTFHLDDNSPTSKTLGYLVDDYLSSPVSTSSPPT